MLHLVEYGKPMPVHKAQIDIERVGQESLLWKRRLGLRELPIAVEYAGPDKFALRAQGVAGVLQAGDEAIEIQPKFLESASTKSWKQALFHILAIVDTLSIFSQGPSVDADQDEAFADLLGHAILDGMNTAREEGYPRGYSEVEGSLPVLRGRLNTAAIATLLVNPHQVPCIYDVYSEDIPINRLLRWAAYRLSNLVRSRQLARQLTEAADELQGVEGTPPGLIEAENLRVSMQYSYLQPAIDAARLLLRQQSLHYQQGAMRGISFLWKSFDVFERFTRHLLTRACAAAPDWNLEMPGLTLAAGIGNTGGLLEAIPDFRIRAQGRTLLILDAKYKTWPREGRPDAANVYQVMAYGRLGNCENVCLIYPLSAHSPNALQTWKIQKKGMPVFVHALFVDLMTMIKQNGEQILVERLKSDIEEIIQTT